MARTRLTEAPPRNDVYVGMLALAVLSMALGCGMLALELTEYGWTESGGARTSVSLPDPSAAPPPKAAPARQEL